MNTFIVLLRGVTPNGKNKVPMVRLREVLNGAGFVNVRTYITSGNVLVDTGLPADEAGKSVHDLVKKHLGPDPVVVVRTGPELQRVLDENPFRQGYDISRVFFVIFAQIPVCRESKGTFSRRLWRRKNCFYQHPRRCLDVYSRPVRQGPAERQFSGKEAGVSATMRNFNTMSRLVEMSKDD